MIKMITDLNAEYSRVTSFLEDSGYTMDTAIYNVMNRYAQETITLAHYMTEEVKKTSKKTTPKDTPRDTRTEHQKSADYTIDVLLARVVERFPVTAQIK